MIELYLLRHADAGDPMAWGGPDAARPLSGKGERQADRLGRFLSGIGFTPDAIVSSPKIRAAQTAEGIARHLGVAVTIDDRLADGVDLRALDDVLRAAGDPARPVLVGHDPDFSDLVETLTASPALTMKKGAMLRIDAERPFEPGGGTLVWLATGAAQARGLGARLDDREPSRRGRECDRRAEAAGQLAEALDRLGPERVPDPGPAALAADPAGVAEDLEMVRDGRLADVAAGGEVAGADLGAVAQLAQDREPGRVGGGLEEQDVRVGLALHMAHCIDRCLYCQVSIQKSRARQHRGAQP